MRSLQFRRNVVTVVALFVSSSVLSACGGGSVPGTIPNATQQQNAGSDSVVQNPNATAAAATSSIHVTSADKLAAKSAKAGKAHDYAPMAGSNKLRPESIVYPGDLQYYGGKFLTTARVFNAFINSTPAAFGDPKSFEEHFSYSNMIHILDQYVGQTANNRYDWAGDAGVAYNTITTLGDNDLLAIVHAVAKAEGGAGYHRIFHIFLPKGDNYCSTGTILPLGACNASLTSPNPSFCAFHDSVVFSDLGETIFTFEPYQDLNFCNVNGAGNPNAPTPNGIQNDSTYSTLSHETSEAITDPDPFFPGLAWYDNNVGVNGEIGDLCAYLPETTNLNGKLYKLQREYSNRVHGCDNAYP